MDKFGRNYSLSIELIDGDTLSVGLPFTTEFDIERSINSSQNTAVLRIYNLSKIHRNQIRFNANNTGTPRSVILKAGYGDVLSLMHYGQIQEAHSYREGVNFITEITSNDAGHAYATADFSQTIPASNVNPVLKTSVLSTLIANLPLVSQGAIGNYYGKYYRPYSFSGSTIDHLRQESGNGFFIDNGKANILRDNEYIISNTIPLINAASGLLGTPQLQLNILTFDMLLEPSLILGQLIQLQSQTFSDFEGNNLNGVYKINSMKHRGMISSAVCGDAITSLGMYYDLGQMEGVRA